MADLEFQVTSDSSQARRDLQQLDGRIGSIESNVSSLSNAFSRIGRAVSIGFGVLTGAGLTSGIARTTDVVRQMNGSLRLATNGLEGFAQGQRDVIRIARTTNADLSATTTLYSRLSRTANASGRSQADAARATEAITLALRASNTSAQQASGSILQLSQALASGQLRGDELNSVLEGMPRIAQLIADELGIGIGEIRAMAREGEITSDVILNALVGSVETLRGEVEQVGLTFGAATQTLDTGMTLFIASLDMSLGLSERLNNRIERIGQFLIDLSLRVPVIFSQLDARVDRFLVNFRIGIRRIRRSLERLFGINLNLDLPDVSQIRDNINNALSEVGDFFVRLFYGDPEAPDATFFQRAQTELSRLGSVIWETIFGDPENGTPGLYDNVQGLVSDLGTVVWTTVFGDPENGTPGLYNTAQDYITDLGDVVWKTIFGDPEQPDQTFLQRAQNLFNSALDSLETGISLVFGIDFMFPTAEEIRQRIARLFSSASASSEIPEEAVNAGVFDGLFQSATDSYNRFLQAIDGTNFGTAFRTVQSFTSSVISFFSGLFNAVIGNSWWTETVESINTSTFQPALDTVREFTEQIQAFFIRLFNTVTNSDVEINFSSPDLRDQQREREAEFGQTRGRQFEGLSLGIGQALSDGFDYAIDLLPTKIGDAIRGISLEDIGLAALFTGAATTGIIAAVLSGGFRRRVRSAFSFIFRTALSLALANPVTAFLVVGETFGNDIQRIIDNIDFSTFGNRLGGVLTGRISVTDFISSPTSGEGDTPQLRTPGVVASLTAVEDGEGSGTLALGAAIGRSFIDLVNGSIAGVFEADTIGDSLRNSFEFAIIAAFGLATVSSTIRGLFSDTVADAFTGFSSTGFTTEAGQTRQLNLDLAQDQRIFARQNAIAGAAGAVGALVAGAVASELEASNYAVVGSAIAGQILLSFTAGELLSGRNFSTIGTAIARAVGTAGLAVSDVRGFGSLIADAFAQARVDFSDLGGRVAGASFGRNILSASLAFLGTAGFWAGLGIIAALGGVLLLAFRRGAEDPSIDEVLSQRTDQARSAFTSDIAITAAGSQAGLSLLPEQIERLQSAVNIGQFQQFAEELGFTEDEVTRLLPSFDAYNRLLIEQARQQRAARGLVEDYNSALAEQSQAFSIFTQTGRRANSTRSDRARIRDIINEVAGEGTIEGTDGQALINAFDMLTDEQQEQARQIIESTSSLSNFANIFSEEQGELRTTINTNNEALMALATQLDVTFDQLVNSFSQNASGGLLGYQTGGRISGPGSGTSDSILARVSNGEYVIRASSVRRYGIGFLDAINEGRLPRFQNGGLIEGLRREAGTLGLEGIDLSNFNGLINALEQRLATIADLQREQTSLAADIRDGDETARDDLAQNRLDIEQAAREQMGALQEVNAYLAGVREATEQTAENTSSTAGNTSGTDISGINGRSINQQIEDIQSTIDSEFDLEDLLGLSDSNRTALLRESNRRVEIYEMLDRALEDSNGRITDNVRMLYSEIDTIEQEQARIARSREFQVGLESDISNGFSNAISTALHGGDVGDALRGVLDNVTSRIINNFADNLTSGLFGENGGFLDSFFPTNAPGADAGPVQVEDTRLANQLPDLFGGLSGFLSMGLSNLGNIIGSISSGVGSGVSSVFSAVSSFLGFQNGGIVPGRGPVPVIAHGGEVILNEAQQRNLLRGMSGNGGENVTVNVSLGITGDVSAQTRQEVLGMLPEIANATQQQFRERRIIP